MLAPCPVTETAFSPLGSPCDLAGDSQAIDFRRAELANSITHGFGFLLSLLAAPLLFISARHADTWQLLACAVYAATMIAVYASSTLSHCIRAPARRQLFRMVDQGCIYLFIAGTFTPIAATYLRGGSWWILSAAIWAVAIGGFISKVCLVHRIDCASVVVPVLLGWMPVAGGPAILQAVPAGVIWWMLAGGVCYTAGTLFLIYDHRHIYMHSIWHLLVIAGSACHFYAIVGYTLPGA